MTNDNFNYLGNGYYEPGYYDPGYYGYPQYSPYARNNYYGYQGGYYAQNQGYPTFNQTFPAVPDNQYYDYYDWEMTDEEIHDSVEDSIYDSDIIRSKDKDAIQIEVDNGIVTLSGTVLRRRSKWGAFNATYWQPGVVDVNNNIKVKQRNRRNA